MLCLQTLGRVELRTAHGGRVRRVKTRPKDLAVLTFLAAARPCGFERRDTLLALFWPDLDAAHGRNALSQALHRLRTSLPAGTLVVQGREEVGVSAERLSCDAALFDAHVRAGELPDALRLYEGDFLAGFHAPGAAPEFDDWVATERERLQRLAFNALLVLVDVEERSGRETAAIEGLRRALTMRPCDETVCRRLVDALTAAGDRAGALAEYHRFARRLRGEHGLSPSAETRLRAEAIRTRQTCAATSGKPRRRVPAPEVAEAFLKGRYFTSTMEHTARGLQCLRHALDLDPTFAPAHAATALSLATLAVMGHLPPRDAGSRAAAAATLAIELDSTLSDAHTAVGVVEMIFDWNWKQAERHLQTGIALNPNASDAHAYYAQLLCAMGRADEGVVEAVEAQRLDPLGVWANFTLGWVLFRARRHDESIQRLLSLLEVYPHIAYAHLFLAENYVSTAAYAAAVEACHTALRILPEDQLLIGLTACVLGFSGASAEARRLLRSLEAQERSGYLCPGHLAAACLGANERDRAFDCWAAMCRDRSALAFLVPTDPLYDPVRDDARFGELFDRLRIPRPARDPDAAAGLQGTRR